MAALEIVMVAAAVLLLITLFLYLWQRLAWSGRTIRTARRHTSIWRSRRTTTTAESRPARLLVGGDDAVSCPTSTGVTFYEMAR